MTTQQTELTRLKAYLTARLEEWEKATKGPWVPDHPLVLKHLDDGNLLIISESDDEPITNCISHARTDSPILLANTLREIDWLTELANASNGLWQNNPFSNRLNEILESFKEVLV